MLPPTKNDVRFKTLTTPCEYIEDYLPGGFHPVHIGDLFNCRYRVLRKLGTGAYSTVWLVVDQICHAYYALKILDADSSKNPTELAIIQHLSMDPVGNRHITKLVDNFKHEGPNGIHTCLLFEPLGPSVNSMVEDLPWFKPRKRGMDIRYPTTMARKVIKQALKSLAYLHTKNIVHGDFHSGNMLFSIRDLTETSEKDLESGEFSPPVERIDGQEDKWAPRYLVVPQSLYKFVDYDGNFVIKLSDFGGSFFHSTPPKQIITPSGLRSPELIFQRPVDKSLDIWSFGCFLFEIFTARPLFCVPYYPDNDEENDTHLLQLSDVLGPLPDDLYALWDRSSRYFTNDRVLYNTLFDEDLPEGTNLLSARVKPLEDAFSERKPKDMSQDEANKITSLIRRILQYKPEDRPSIDEILKDPWFDMNLA